MIFKFGVFASRVEQQFQVVTGGSSRWFLRGVKLQCFFRVAHHPTKRCWKTSLRESQWVDCRIIGSELQKKLVTHGVTVAFWKVEWWIFTMPCINRNLMKSHHFEGLSIHPYVFLKLPEPQKSLASPKTRIWGLALPRWEPGRMALVIRWMLDTFHRGEWVYEKKTPLSPWLKCDDCKICERVFPTPENSRKTWFSRTIRNPDQWNAGYFWCSKWQQ